MSSNDTLYDYFVQCSVDIASFTITMNESLNHSETAHTHVSIQEVQGGFDECKRVSEQLGLSTVHVLGTQSQVLDDAGHPAHPTLTIQPLNTACQTGQKCKTHSLYPFTVKGRYME